MKKIFTVVMMLFTASLFAQNITTASTYFKTISEYYGTLQDYEVDFEIIINGDTLTVYLPKSSAVLLQQVDPSATEKAALSTPQGLALMSRYYSVAYEVGQAAVPLEEGSDEMVVKFVLHRKNASETFRSIKIAVNEATKLIRRIEAVTPNGEEFIFNFFDYKLNQNITEQRFIYDAPSSANNYNNFLFSE